MAFGKWQRAPQPPHVWRLLLWLAAVIAAIIFLQRYAALHAR
jgi:predicted secreted protein